MTAIHETVPDSPLEAGAPADWGDFKERVRCALQKGRDGIRTSGELAALAGIQPKGTNEQVRKAITELLERDGVRVVSTGRGYYIAETADDVRKSLDGLDAKLRGGYRRRKAYKRVLGELEAEEETRAGDRLVPEPPAVKEGDRIKMPGGVEGIVVKAEATQPGDALTLFDEPADKPDKEWDPEYRKWKT